MYAGQVVETGTVAELFDTPGHPYTQGLLAAVPHPGRPAAMLQGIPGTLPNLLTPPEGCRFRGRCHAEMAACSRRPPGHGFTATHSVHCWLHAGQGDA
jgi:oligopeptide/dipeptide ABC transporter ATP-binding protein